MVNYGLMQRSEYGLAYEPLPDADDYSALIVHGWTADEWADG